MRRTTLTIALGVMLALALVPSPARATDAASAQVLFDEALALMARGRYDEACPKLEASQKLDPGPGTQYRLAQCYEQTGRAATAWALYTEVAQAAKHAAEAARAADAQQHADALAPKLAHVRIELSAETRALPGLEVSRDGSVLDPTLFDSELPVDAGSHSVRASAPGHAPFTATFVVQGTTRTLVKVPPLEIGDGSPPLPPTPPLRIAGIVIGGAGVVGLGVGAFGAVLANSKWQSARAICPAADPAACTSAGVSLGHQANTFANVANVGFIAGGALAAAGVVLFIVSPRAAPADAPTATGALSLHPSAGGARLAWRWTF